MSKKPFHESSITALQDKVAILLQTRVHGVVKQQMIVRIQELIDLITATDVPDKYKEEFQKNLNKCASNTLWSDYPRIAGLIEDAGKTFDVVVTNREVEMVCPHTLERNWPFSREDFDAHTTCKDEGDCKRVPRPKP